MFQMVAPPKKYDILTSKVSLESEQKNICAEKKKEETKDASLLSPVRGMYVLLDTFHVFLIFS